MGCRIIGSIPSFARSSPGAAHISSHGPSPLLVGNCDLVRKVAVETQKAGGSPMRSLRDALASVTPALRTRLRSQLGILLEAYDCAVESQRDPWEFAVEIENLRAVGSTRADLRWLCGKGYVQHAVETTKSASKRRAFDKRGELVFGKKTCFVLTEAGARLARGLVGDTPFCD